MKGIIDKSRAFCLVAIEMDLLYLLSEDLYPVRRGILRNLTKFEIQRLCQCGGVFRNELGNELKSAKRIFAEYFSCPEEFGQLLRENFLVVSGGAVGRVMLEGHEHSQYGAYFEEYVSSGLVSIYATGSRPSQGLVKVMEYLESEGYKSGEVPRIYSDRVCSSFSFCFLC